MVATARDQVDDLTYNPKGSMQHDDAAYNDTGDIESAHPVGARGADNQPTNRNFSQEDQETEKSEHTGKIPRSEVNDLLDSATKDERGASGRTRGVKNDAFKQEREMDQALADTGITDAEQSVEIGRATGPTS